MRSLFSSFLVVVVCIADAFLQRKGKGVFGRMFGSSSSSNNKEHHRDSPPNLNSPSQLSLSARSNAEVSSPQSNVSPQLPPSFSPQFPGNAQFTFEAPQSNGNARPPVPQRHSGGLVPGMAEPHEPSRISISSTHSAQEIIVDPQDPSKEPSTRVHNMLQRGSSMSEERSASRRSTAEEARAAPPRASTSFSDDVTGLLDRISHGDPPVGVGIRTQEPETTEHLQVSPDPSRYSQRSGSPLSPANQDNSTLPDAPPVPVPASGKSSASSTQSSRYDDAQATEGTAVIESALADTSETDLVPPPVPVKGEPTIKMVPNNNNNSSSSSRHDDGIVAIEVTQSPNRSTTSLDDLPADEEERAHQLAREFYQGDSAHVSTDKVAIFLGGPKSVNTATLRHYMQHFDMRGSKLDQAFRDLCAKLHLKAESQEIDRIIEGFSARYFDCNPNTVFGTPGVVHTVTAAMLMLNTDLHIAELQKHMSRADFVRNAMRAIQESMPEDLEVHNDSGSLRGVDGTSTAAQSTSSITRLRQPTNSRNASGSLAPASELSSPSSQDLRSRAASSTTVNSFTYSKQWEVEAEAALKEIYSNVRNEKILLPIGSADKSSLSLNSYNRRGIGPLKRSSVKGNSPYNGSGVFAHSDGRLSPTPSYANSIGEVS